MKLLSFADLPDRGISYSRAHVYKLISAGKFPKPIKLGEQRVAFVESEVDAWIKTKIAERDAENRAA